MRRNTVRLEFIHIQLNNSWKLPAEFVPPSIFLRFPNLYKSNLYLSLSTFLHRKFDTREMLKSAICNEFSLCSNFGFAEVHVGVLLTMLLFQQMSMKGLFLTIFRFCYSYLGRFLNAIAFGSYVFQIHVLETMDSFCENYFMNFHQIFLSPCDRSDCSGIATLVWPTREQLVDLHNNELHRKRTCISSSSSVFCPTRLNWLPNRDIFEYNASMQLSNSVNNKTISGPQQYLMKLSAVQRWKFHFFRGFLSSITYRRIPQFVILCSDWSLKKYLD